jgi:hypothetical protein
VGGLHPHRHPRRLRRGQPLIAALTGLLFAAEIAVLDLPEGAVITVEGAAASHGHEARGLDGGTHTVMVYDPGGQLREWKPVMVGGDERVELRGYGLVEAGRQPAPVRDPAAELRITEQAPQWVDVVVSDRSTTRVQLDGRPVPYDLRRGSHAVRAAAGERELLITVGGRRRHQQPLQVAGAPWRCGVERDGGTVCVQLAPGAREGPPMDVDAALAQLARTTPARRLEVLAELPGTVSCQGVARLMGVFVGDEDKVAVARLLRPRVVDPGARQVVVDAVSFPDARQLIEGLYAVR